jgi:hypothetical protein
MMNFRSLAKRHWEKYLPGLVKELKARGIYEEQLDSAAKWASEELARMVSGGAQIEAAKEIVLKEYIFLDPETAE